MDFHTLSRKDLQALCKKNKIPANQTNVAMADALKALDLVEGVEEIMQPSQSESGKPAIESLPSSGLASPYVPPTGGRSTRRRNIPKEEIESVNPTTRTRRTARKNLVKDTDESQADAIETPVLVAQTNRSKLNMASACRKMDSQFKECVAEKKRDVLMTPAPLGATSRRRRVDETAVKRVYSTRRSARLVERNVEMPNQTENEHSGITGVDAATITEEDSVNEDKSEFVADENQEKSISKDINLGSTAEDELCIKFEAEAELEEEKCGNKEDSYFENTVVPLNVSNEIQSDVENTEDNAEKVEEDSYSENTVLPLNVSNEIQSYVENIEEHTEKDEEYQDQAADSAENVILESTEGTEGPYGESIVLPMNVSFEVDVQSDVESTEEMNTEKDAESQDGDAVFVENIVLDSKDDFVVDEFSSNTGFCDEVEKEVYHDKDMNTENIPDFDETVIKFTELELQKFMEEVPQLEESEKAAQRYAGVDGGDNADYCVDGAEDVPFMIADFSEHIPTSGFAVLDSHLNVKPSCLTPSKFSASKGASRVIGLSDNKENFGAVIEEIAKVAKSTVENANDLSELSMRKLTKMLREKLVITQKSSKNEDGKEAVSRPALQALPENQMVDGTQK